MKKRILNMLLVLLLVLAFASPVFASSNLIDQTLPRVVDYGNLFSDAEEKALETELYKLINKYGYDFVIMTAENHASAPDDKAFMEYVWDNNDFGTSSNKSGWMIFVCMDCRQWWHDAYGDASPYMTNDTVNIIDDFMEGNMVSGDYYGAMMAAIAELDSLFRLGPTEYYNNTYSPIVDPIIDPPAPHSFWDKLKTGGISGVIAGIVAGLASVGNAKRSMRTVSRAYTAGEYIEPGSFRLYKAENILLNVHTQRIIKEQAPPPSSAGSSGGGMPHHSGGSSYSGPHTSPGGNVHSTGGGRKF
jgi:uncharacterized membrane protein YgcG